MKIMLISPASYQYGAPYFPSGSCKRKRELKWKREQRLSVLLWVLNVYVIFNILFPLTASKKEKYLQHEIN